MPSGLPHSAQLAGGARGAVQIWCLHILDWVASHARVAFRRKERGSGCPRSNQAVGTKRRRSDITTRDLLEVTAAGFIVGLLDERAARRRFLTDKDLHAMVVLLYWFRLLHLYLQLPQSTALACNGRWGKLCVRRHLKARQCRTQFTVKREKNVQTHFLLRFSRLHFWVTGPGTARRRTSRASCCRCSAPSSTRWRPSSSRKQHGAERNGL